MSKAASLKEYCLVLLSTCFLLSIFSPVEAEVASDSTLSFPSRVNQIDENRFVITGGTSAGNNLFHSFESFSIAEQGIASFQNIDPATQRIISRVTGSSRSNIDGIVEVLQINGTPSGADFFLINPNGIVFGPNVSLNIGGSFVGTTAEALIFSDGTVFNTSTSHNDSLLTVNTPIGLQFGQSPGDIRVTQGGVPFNAVFGGVKFDEPEFEVPTGLQVSNNRTLALVGGHIQLSGGILTARGGRLELGSVGDFNQVSITQRNQSLVLDYSDVENFRDISIDNQSFINASDSQAGSVQIQGRDISLDESSSILANTVATGSVLGISIHSSANFSLNNQSIVSANIFGQGRGGDININADALTFRGGAQVFANIVPRAEGNGGDIFAAANLLQVIGGQTLETNKLDSNSLVEDSFQSSGIRAVVLQDALGDGGNIRIETGSLNISQGGQVATGTRGQGNSGSIHIHADNVQLTNIARLEDGFPLVLRNATVPSSVSSVSTITSSGNGGDIFLEARNLRVLDAATIQAATVSNGDAGNITIRVTDSIELDGVESGFRGGLFSFSGGSPGRRFNLGRVANVRRNATGRGGNIDLQTETLLIRDGAIISVGSLNESTEARGAGDITIQSDQIRLIEEGSLLAATASGDGGDITLLAEDLLLLRQNSLVETTAGVEQAGGDGGNITIDADFVLSLLEEDSNIRANAFTGRGGAVTVTSQGLFGIEPQPLETPLSDITASSEFGAQGTIEILTPDVEPEQGLIEPPVIAAQPQIQQGCAADLGESSRPSSFTTTGRGGLPLSPSGILSPVETLDDLGPELEHASLFTGDVVQDVDDDFLQPTSIVEARGLALDAEGKVILSAQTPAALYYDEPQQSALCRMLGRT